MTLGKTARCIVRLSAAALSFASVLVPSAAAQADVIIVEHAAPPREAAADYRLEVEPHFSFGAENVYGATGFGGGVRLSVPLVGGSIGRLPDNLAISFGGDLLHYDNCYYGSYCSANYLMVPVAAQWNVFVARRVSLFAEGGAFVYKGWFDPCAPGDGPGCSAPSDFGVLPTLAIGGRIHLGENASFTARIGYPTMTLGVSFL